MARNVIVLTGNDESGQAEVRDLLVASGYKDGGSVQDQAELASVAGAPDLIVVTMDISDCSGAICNWPRVTVVWVGKEVESGLFGPPEAFVLAQVVIVEASLGPDFIAELGQFQEPEHATHSWGQRVYGHQLKIPTGNPYGRMDP